MSPAEAFCWPADVAEAEAIQRRLIPRVELRPLARPLRTVAALDASYREGSATGAAVLFDLESLTCVEEAVATVGAPFPYHPGLLFFREGPAVLAALGRLSSPPDLILADGQGIAHPRGFGIASQLGVLTGLPAVGCAKSRLVGIYREPGVERGCWSPLLVEGTTVGAVGRAPPRGPPLFVSPGHLVSVEDAVAVVLRLCTQYRIPQPLRRADALSRQGG